MSIITLDPNNSPGQTVYLLYLSELIHRGWTIKLSRSYSIPEKN